MDVNVRRDERIDLSGVLAEQLRVDVRTLGSTSTIRLQGEWDIAGEPATRHAVARVLEGRPECVVLDLGRLSFMDAVGVHATADLRQRSDAQNTRVVVIPGPRQVQRVFEICRLLDVSNPSRRQADCR